MSAIQEQDFGKQKIKLSTWKKVLSYAKNNRKYIYISLGFGMITGILDLGSSLANMWAIDAFIVPQTYQNFGWFAFIFLMIQILFALCSFIFTRSSGQLEAHLAADIRKDGFKKLQTMSFSYFDKTTVGYLLTKLTSDVNRTIETISWCFIDLGWGIMAIIVGVIGMLFVNIQLAMYVLLALPFLVAISVFFQKKILQHHRMTRRLNSMIISYFNEGISGAKTTKTLVRESLNNQEFRVITKDMSHESLRAAIVSGLYMPIASLVMSVTVALMMIHGGYQVQNMSLSIGELSFFMNIGMMMFEPIRSFARIFADIQSSQAAAERVVSVLEAESDIQDTPEVIHCYGDVFNPRLENFEPIEGDIVFRDVSFAYDQGQKVLDHFNLSIEKGQTVALVGATGSGKSTIVNLICRFYEPTSGTILLDGKDIKERSQLWLHSHLGYVLQSPHLFSGSIKENIRYGKLDATDEEIIEVSKKIGCHDFIEKLDLGYDTLVGEGGSLLSTGQKQLISFARAMIADPSIFILDEATSSIDTDSEQKIQEASQSMFKNRTSLVIAHRLSTIKDASRILVIDHGQIIEDGTHHQLMQKKGYYYELYTHQFKEGQIEQSLEILS